MVTYFLQLERLHTSIDVIFDMGTYANMDNIFISLFELIYMIKIEIMTLMLTSLVTNVVNAFDNMT